MPYLHPQHRHCELALNPHESAAQAAVTLMACLQDESAILPEVCRCKVQKRLLLRACQLLDYVALIPCLGKIDIRLASLR